MWEPNGKLPKILFLFKQKSGQNDLLYIAIQKQQLNRNTFAIPELNISFQICHKIIEAWHVENIAIIIMIDSLIEVKVAFGHDLKCKLLRKSINVPYLFEQILGKILSSLDTDDTENGL